MYDNTKLLTVVIGMAAIVTLAACSQSPDAAAKAQLYNSAGQQFSPASSNCYPDINYCASYPTGDVSKGDPAK